MQGAARERIKAYGLLVLFVALIVAYAAFAAPAIQGSTVAVAPAEPLLAAAAAVSLLTIIPMVMTFRPASAGKLVAAMRAKASRSDKHLTYESACRTVSLYVAALASTPAMYGLALVFLVGDFELVLFLLPAVALLAAVGWFVLGRFFEAMSSRFIR